MNSFMAFRRGIEFFHDAECFLLPRGARGVPPSSPSRVCDDLTFVLCLSIRL